MHLVAGPDTDGRAGPVRVQRGLDFGSRRRHLRHGGDRAYAVTWGALDGWRTPSGETQTVAAGARVTYSATYVNDNGAEPIVVDHRAVYATAGWPRNCPLGRTAW